MRRSDDSTTIRRVSPNDLDLFMAYRTDPEIARYQSWEVMDADRTRNFLAFNQSVVPLIRPGEWVQIGIAETGSDALIGDLGIKLSGDQAEAELGITLAAHAHGLGHGLRATQLACNLIWDETPADVIKVWADIRNAPSRALAERAGFTFIGFETNDGVDEAAFSMPRPQLD
ncbi:MAG: GNAT family N-acetyltransferase [Pseudomonadota bacterium]